MKKTILFLIIFTLSLHTTIYSQTIVKNEIISNYESLPQEKIYVHLNTTFLLTGDYLYYKIYCLNSTTNNLSDLSKIVYVELIDTNKKIIFKHKLRIYKGLGQGDFFIPSSIPSGNYKLIAYTQWMRNLGENYFFQNNLSIINPFQFEQDKIISLEKLDSLKPIVTIHKVVNFKTNKHILLEVNKKKFKKRREVTLKLNSLKDNKSFGNYSISVRKIENTNTPTRAFADNDSFKNTNGSKLKKDSIYLPELRGELISGKVITKETNKTVPNISVALSIPNKDFILKISKTNKNGVFYFNLENEYKSENIFIQIIDNQDSNLQTVINRQTSPNYSNLNFDNFRISTRFHNSILKHSIYNQIENAYSNAKPIRYKKHKSKGHFFTDEIELEYYLDDYTRFPTIKETIVEIVNSVWIGKKGNQYTFHVRSSDLESNLPPLVIVDGVFINNHNEIVFYDTKKIKKISVIRDSYVYGSKLFKGIISIETFNGDYKGDLTSLKWSMPKIDKIYYKQEYDNKNTFNRIPDYRTQLLWLPNLKLNKKEKLITFFTSDNDGEYEICLEGYTNEGKPVSLRKIFSVE